MDRHQLDGVSLKKCPEILRPLLVSKLCNQQVGRSDVTRLSSLVLGMPLNGRFVSVKHDIGKSAKRDSDRFH